MQVQLPRILYFINGPTPNPTEVKNALALGTRSFRNVRWIQPDANLEECDSVAGCVPPQYLAKYPRADAPKPDPTANPVPPQQATGTVPVVNTKKPAGDTEPPAKK